MNTAPPDFRRSRSARIAAWLSSMIRQTSGRNRIEGFVDRVVAEEVYGWAFDSAHPNRRVLVTATVGGAVISEALADLPRKDLLEAGKGDGRHGFRLRLPGDLQPEQRSSLRIEAVAKPRNVTLQRGEIILSPPSQPKEADPSPTSTRPSVGFLESFRDGALRGWAVDPNHPAAPARVDFYDGELYLGTVTCDRERPKSAQLGARDFVFAMPTGFEQVTGSALRARITGTRLDLKRSRDYPGAALAADDKNEPLQSASDPSESGTEPSGKSLRAEIRARHRTTAASVDVLFLVCGASPDPDTLASCGDQAWANVKTAVAPGDDAVLRKLVTSSQITVLIPSGERVDRELATSLMQARATSDVWSWLTEDPATTTPEPAAAVLLSGSFNGGLAFRSAVLGGFESDLAATLSSGRIDTVAHWAAQAGLRWTRLAAQLSTGSIGIPAATAVSPAPPLRITLAVWSGWHRSVPAAMAGLLSQCNGLQVEILMPADGGNDLEDLLTALAPEVAALTLRRVDSPPGEGPETWRRLCEAASGQVVVLCHGDVVMTAKGSALNEACAWAHQAPFGGVTIEIGADDEQPPLAGLTVAHKGKSLHAINAFDSRLAGRPRTVLAAPPLFLALSRSSLAAIGRSEIDGHSGVVAAIDLSLRLRQAGWVIALLGQHRATAPRSIIEAVVEAPFSPPARALVGEAAEREAVGYPPPEDRKDE